jgi:hypothetical protein
MKSVVVPALIAIVLAVAGGTFWIAGEADRRVAEVHVQLATLQYGAANRSSAEVEQSLELERRLPIVGREATDDLHGAATTARYWQSDYAGVEPQHDASGAISDTDPTVLLMAANAQFRASQAATERLDTLRRLDGAIKSYSDALRAPGQQVDAAFNYEYAVRVREAISKARPGAAAKNASARKAADDPSDLPAGPTLHGHPGAPPTKSEMSQFKIVIPKRGEERKDNPEAGKGGQKIRKG